MGSQINRLLLILIAVFGFVGLYMLQNPGYLALWDVFGLISLGFVGVSSLASSGQQSAR